MLGNFNAFLVICCLHSKCFFENFFQKHYNSNQSDKWFASTDKDQHSIGPDLGLNCLQRLSADEKSQSGHNIGTEKPVSKGHSQ